MARGGGGRPGRGKGGRRGALHLAVLSSVGLVAAARAALAYIGWSPETSVHCTRTLQGDWVESRRDPVQIRPH
jgi:hypothetical protein